MNSSENPPDTTAEDQASLWAARLDGATLSKSERKELEDWLAAKPHHRALLSEFCQLSTDLEEQLPALIGSPAVPVPQETAPDRNTARASGSWKKTWFVAATLAAAAAIAVAVLPRDQGVQPQNIATAIGQRQTMDLADGSRIELNARTSLVIEQSNTERRVRLAGGEAFFSVAKNPDRPFIVETPAGSVQVTGTAFNVRSEAASQIEVTVLEGSVQVRPGETSHASAPVRLAAGGRFIANDRETSLRVLNAAEVEAYLAWRQGQIVFDNVNLTEALSRFAHFHGRGISASAETAHFKVGGRFSLEDLEGFLAALEEIHPVRISRDLSGTIRVEARAQPSPSPVF